MHIYIFLTGILIMAFSMVMAKRMPALIGGFAAQSFFLFLATLSLAIRDNHLDLYIIAMLIFAIKVVLIPGLIRRIAKRIKVGDGVGLFVNPLLSLFIAVLLTYMAYLFTYRIIVFEYKLQAVTLGVSISVTLIGLFIMIFRIKAIAQVIGLLVMENGIFLAAAAVSEGMPFFVEIAIFLDVFISVVILGTFVYRINDLFTHIDVDKLNMLKR